MKVLIDKKSWLCKTVYNHGAGEYLEIKCIMMNYWYHLTLITLKNQSKKKELHLSKKYYEI